ncbi:extracellular catalytic domain type 1 short-chain-length polyhydroxyalkanoate depolymerase [Parvularcula dongshanensis]|uniref:Poly(Hydroxyalkanoate) depolymerase family esterase n=1 Tax=Parvularcula dongshanensis TaxID=1173995 RepID=A0A840I1Y9_9PROT|nr:PHB depolymerase family esterase [Parvularcula dongshanensis]MBB4658355.1 poly(hydroxyalkanoate) depolymerase family esterase [Parvularcula dongshanensis]
MFDPLSPSLASVLRTAQRGWTEPFSRLLGRQGRGEGSWAAHRYRGAGGARDYRLYRPSSLPRRPALLVMLHGCAQNAEDFARGTRVNPLADRAGVLVLYPEQSRLENPQGCWNWFRGEGASGEAALLASLIRDVAAKEGADPRRIFLAGLSAGGAMAARLAASYPELAAGLFVHSGVPSGAAVGVRAAIAAMRSGPKDALPGTPRTPTLIFHGDQDTTVSPRNAEALARQAAGGPRLVLSREARGEANGRRYVRRTTHLAHGTPLCESWTVEGLGHAWSGGDPSGSYTDPAGPDASEVMMRFFLRLPARGAKVPASSEV